MMLCDGGWYWPAMTGMLVFMNLIMAITWGVQKRRGLTRQSDD